MYHRADIAATENTRARSAGRIVLNVPGVADIMTSEAAPGIGPGTPSAARSWFRCD